MVEPLNHPNKIWSSNWKQNIWNHPVIVFTMCDLIKWGRFYYITSIQLASVGTCVISKHRPLPTRALPGILSKSQAPIKQSTYRSLVRQIYIPLFRSICCRKPWFRLTRDLELNMLCCILLKVSNIDNIWHIQLVKCSLVVLLSQHRRNPEACCVHFSQKNDVLLCTGCIYWKMFPTWEMPKLTT